MLLFVAFRLHFFLSRKGKKMFVSHIELLAVCCLFIGVANSQGKICSMSEVISLSGNVYGTTSFGCRTVVTDIPMTIKWEFHAPYTNGIMRSARLTITKSHCEDDWDAPVGRLIFNQGSDDFQWSDTASYSLGSSTWIATPGNFVVKWLSAQSIHDNNCKFVVAVDYPAVASHRCGSTPFTRTVNDLSQLPENSLHQRYFGCNDVSTGSRITDSWQLQLPNVAHQVTLVSKNTGGFRLVSAGQSYWLWSGADYSLFPRPNSMVLFQADIAQSHDYQFFTVFVEPNRYYCDARSATATHRNVEIGAYFGCLGMGMGTNTFTWTVPPVTDAKVRILRFRKERDNLHGWPAFNLTVETRYGEQHSARRFEVALFAPDEWARVTLQTASAHPLPNFRALMQVTTATFGEDFCSTSAVSSTMVAVMPSVRTVVCNGWLAGAEISVSFDSNRTIPHCVGLSIYDGFGLFEGGGTHHVKYNVTYGPHSYQDFVSLTSSFANTVLGCFPAGGFLHVSATPKGISGWPNHSHIAIDLDSFLHPVAAEHPNFCSGVDSQHIVLGHSNASSHAFFCNGHTVNSSRQWTIDFIDGAEYCVNSSSVDINFFNLSLMYFDRHESALARPIDLIADERIRAWQKVRAGTRLVLLFNPSLLDWAQPDDSVLRTTLLTRSMPANTSAFEQVECPRGVGDDDDTVAAVAAVAADDDGTSSVGGSVATNLTLMVYNAEWLFWPKRLSKWRNHDYDHFSFVANVLQQLNPDVVGLVEIGDCRTLHELSAYVSSRSRREQARYTPYLTMGSDTFNGQNVGLLTRVQPVHREVHRFSGNRSKYPLEDTRCPCTSGCQTGTTSLSKQLYALLPVNDELTVAFFLVHLLAVPSDVSDRCVKREAQAILIQHAVRDALAAGHEVIVAGDMNDFDVDVVDEARSQPVSRVLDILKDNGTLVNVASLVDVEQDGPVYSCWYDVNRDGVDQGGNEHTLIDHVLVSSRLLSAVSSVRFHHELPSRAAYAFASDHWPLVVDFTFTSRLGADESNGGEHNAPLGGYLTWAIAGIFAIVVLVVVTIFVARRCRTCRLNNAADHVTSADGNLHRELLDESEQIEMDEIATETNGEITGDVEGNGDDID
jgi:exonuclease III/uncharacterized membrane protein